MHSYLLGTALESEDGKQVRGPGLSDSQPSAGGRHREGLIRSGTCCDLENGRISQGFLEEMMPMLDSEEEVQGRVEKPGSKSHCQPHEGTEHTVVSSVSRALGHPVDAQSMVR